MYNVADFLYISHMTGTHLTDENFVGGFQGPSYGLDHAHRRVVAGRGHEHVEPALEKGVEKIFDAGFSVASCYADDR